MAINNAVAKMPAAFQVVSMDLETCLMQIEEDFDMMDDDELLADDVDEVFEYQTEHSVEYPPSFHCHSQLYKVCLI